MATDESSDSRGARRVFISHHSSQHAAAQRVKAALAAAGIAGWIAPDDVDPGSAYDDEIRTAIREADAVVLLLCAEADRSRHVKREIMLADDGGKPIFPVRLEAMKADGLAYWLQDQQWIDWFGGKGDGLDRLVAAVGGAPASPIASSPASRPPRRALPIAIAGAVAAAGLAAWWLVPGMSEAEPFFRPGLWLDKREMIAVTYPPVTQEAAEQIKQTVENDPNPEECILDAVARKPDVKLFDPGNKGKCTLSNFQIGGGRMSGYLTCPMPGVKGGSVLIAFRGSYTSTSIEVDQDVTMAQPGGTLKFKSRENSHWVADKCSAGSR